MRLVAKIAEPPSKNSLIKNIPLGNVLSENGFVMMVYQIHRLRESARQQFRWAPHIAGVSIVKSRDYEPASTIEAASPYAAWLMLREGEDALQVGDVLESPAGDLRIFKYIGFEEARWFVAEPIPTEGAIEVA
jgi:hypothetical protein